MVDDRRVHVDELARELELNVLPFRVRDAAPELEPRFLRVDEAEDTPSLAGPRALSIELSRGAVGRGKRVTGSVLLTTPRPLYLRRGMFQVETEIETNKADDGQGRRLHRRTSLIDRELVFFGHASGGLPIVDRLLAAIDRAGKRLLVVPAGQRRWPFCFTLGLGYSPTVHHVAAGEEDRVSTHLRVILDSPSVGPLKASCELEVR